MRARVLAWPALWLVALAPAIARADAPDVDTTVRVRFTTTADADAIQRATCAAETLIRVDGASAPMVVRIERPDATVECAKSAGATRALVVHIGALANGRRDVTLDMDLGGTSLLVADQILDALYATSLELERRVPSTTESSTRALSPTLTAFGIALGVTGIAAVIASYIWTLALIVKPASCSEPLSVSVPIFGSCVTASEYLQTEVLEIAGVATMGLGATLALVGQVRVKVAPVVAPIRGGFSGGFVIRF